MGRSTYSIRLVRGVIVVGAMDMSTNPAAHTATVTASAVPTTPTHFRMAEVLGIPVPTLALGTTMGSASELIARFLKGRPSKGS
jgi:hypothetical protein